MVDYDVVFLSETHANGSLMKYVEGFNIIADPTFTSNNNGGMASYVSCRLFPYITNIRFSKCTLSFSFSILPGFCFMLTYMYPLDSINYNLDDFGILSEELSYWLDNGFIPFMGGDYNARLGDLGILAQKTLKWRYSTNIDSNINSHGRLLADICELHNILPLNHCNYYDRIWDGRFTYHKAGKSSQIDFVFTNQQGRKYITDFKIIDSSWHMSDHLPLSLHLRLPFQISMDMLFARALELNTSFQPTKKISACRFKFNFDGARELMECRLPVIEDIFKDNSPDNIIAQLDDNLIPILNMCKVKNNVNSLDNGNNDYVKECDCLFNDYVCKTKDRSDALVVNTALEKYQTARNRLAAITLKANENKYKNIIEHGDERKLWSEINWSGKHKDAVSQQIPIEVMSNYFESLYQPLDLNEKSDMEKLQSNVYIPINDDPITYKELQQASSKMKKGGYDYSLEVLKLLMSCISPLLLILFNLIFYVTYPIKFGMSILATIPKKGNLKLLTNYRGIHMQNLLSLLYDRIIANRLMIWAKINPEQSAFQKGKSTLNNIFLLRVITSLTKYAKVPLYIGFFDLAKAFDKVSRPLLLKSLIKLGIGSFLFYAIKAMYSMTRCIIKSGKKLSEVFITHSGIKQGAPSSVILFIIFMDEFIDIIRDTCVREQIIEVLHILLHADDTVVLSTDRTLFMKKCNTLITAFKAKKVSLNLGKSGFLVISPITEIDHCDIKLDSGWLKYCSSYVYLGVIISDNGTVAVDVDMHIEQREKSVFVKLANFMRNNPAAPITVKRKILNSCLNTSLLYGCETWGSASLRKAETLYRKAIKITFGMKRNTSNEIIFIESGLIELKSDIYKRQYKFWKKILELIDNDPESEVSKILTKGITMNVHYIRHYKKLVNDFDNEQECYNHYKLCFTNKLKEKIALKTRVNTYSALDDYIKMNPMLIAPQFNLSYVLPEDDRQLLIKYRSGSHMLKVNTGYYQRIAMEERVCLCKEIQTLEHVIIHCPYTEAIRNEDGTSMQDFFNDNCLAVTKLKVIEDILSVRRF